MVVGVHSTAYCLRRGRKYGRSHQFRSLSFLVVSSLLYCYVLVHACPLFSITSYTGAGFLGVVGILYMPEVLSKSKGFGGFSFLVLTYSSVLVGVSPDECATSTLDVFFIFIVSLWAQKFVA